ncbi:type IV toxin-antitoxin system YeeU family antitoxin [Aeromonas veronii]
MDARSQQRITIHHGSFTCEADTLGSYGYVYLTIYHTQDTADRHVLA